ncbi:MAG: nitroreductase family protein [Flavobacteriales bacterium]|nr:nitroreductase family protein [Flavobacteriales bacterium]MCB9191696.1 nitroreductase family protein [Flavobacteriales bacterium]MCB9203646.1 nitroreductase family protein [Flavobacteriales bacterium]
MADSKEGFIPYEPLRFSEEEMKQRSEDFFHFMDKRRSLRVFSDQPVPKAVIENIIRTASTAPSGAHQQPWTFCAVSSVEIKSKIREAAEKEEYENYHGRMSDRWLKDLEPFGTDHIKPFLEIAPWLIIVMKRSYEFVDGEKKNNYYATESVGLATGFLLAAIHNAGLVALTHTPSPMNFLSKVLGRPENEKPFLLIPVGFPAVDATVPKLERKTLEQMAVFY